MAAGSHTEALQDQARDISRDLKDSAKDSARAMLGEQQRATAGGLGEFAGALRKAAREMDDGGSPQVSRIAQTAADGLERLSRSLREQDFDGLVREAESFARRQPVVFFGAAVAAGFLAMRFLKASNRPASETSNFPNRGAGDAHGSDRT
jgi:hypothetical protein